MCVRVLVWGDGCVTVPKRKLDQKVGTPEHLVSSSNCRQWVDDRRQPRTVLCFNSIKAFCIPTIGPRPEGAKSTLSYFKLVVALFFEQGIRSLRKPTHLFVSQTELCIHKNEAKKICVRKAVNTALCSTTQEWTRK